MKNDSRIWERLGDEAQKKLREMFPQMRPPRNDVPSPPRVKDVRLDDSSSDAYTISIHALKRMDQRWPQLVAGLTDEEVARVIQGEINDALIGGRHGSNVPLELANNNIERWRAKKGVWYCWTEDKRRGYACLDDTRDGLLVLTTLIGEPREQARRKLVRRR